MKVSEFPFEIGTVFENPKDIKAEEYNKYDDIKTEFTILPRGTYLLVDKDSHGFDLYEINENKNVFFEASWLDEDTNFETLYVDPKTILELAIDSITKKILTLSSEGWTADPNNKYFDITPYLYKLETLQIALDTINRYQNLDSEEKK